MTVTLCAVDAALYPAFVDAFANETDVTVVYDDILNLSGDAIVSPANSFGWMDGGIDLLYRNRFGVAIERRAIEAAANHDGCAIPVGSATTVATDDTFIPWLILAPTMRYPQPVPASDHAYLAFRAALTEACARQFEHVLSPGMCTGVGRMHPVQAAAQMARAYREFAKSVSATTR
ncbi:hypothetical protein C7H84_09475 [Burkholderia sp. Nafp2/4-1b]|uniref:macro domain-containing protein n=1 Tax=Burkholderia sp. Nafp2/4-1b TaxID=2116686 RepID=UPI000EF8DEAC|nr:macro domain-containing protein [Burkholderia sp. Nafp2/4-1b]RKU03360.1 hypothetical protein C7H84_09475 [Burkholderia sp. Nafp2/4-1b]